MLRKYTLHNFKNHADTSMDLRNLTILTGMNGMGKSSILQSMLILRDSYLRRPSMELLTLDGQSFSVGKTAELVNRSVSDKQDLLHFGLETEEGWVTMAYRYPEGNANEMELAEGNVSAKTELLKKTSLFNDDFQYLSAFRMGPQPVYQSHTGVVDKHRQISDRMGMGEYVAYFLNQFGKVNIPIAPLAYHGSESLSLRVQTELWMGEISEGVRLQINEHGGQYDLKYGYEVPGKITTYHSALNTGFGISYVLAVVVAVLSARPGALLLIENPEAHIHPSGQSALMRLVSMAASYGVQIILETHSDHIINGALVNWKEMGISRDLLSVYYFDRDENLNSLPKRLKVGDNGRIKNAPQGFFDQMKADLEVLFDF